jgi:hypothetical protein
MTTTLDNNKDQTPDDGKNEEPEPYNLTVDLNVLNHLGFNLYSNVPAVLSEVIANSWDADAENVEIVLDKTSKKVAITDDGVGMSLVDINERYLKVGYQKRAEVTVTPKGRHVMGRKGIGKLSLFSIASYIEVQSAKATPGGTEKNGFTMDANEIKKAIGAKGGTYHPKKIEPSSLTVDKGTRLGLADLAKNLTGTTENALRRRLARRFSVIGPEYNFSVKINGKPILVEDREYFKSLEYMWTVGEEGKAFKAKAPKVKRSDETIDGVVDAELDYRVTGWVGTFDEQKNIEEGENAIVVLAWGKLVHEDVLRDIKRGGLFTKYLSGELRADFLDLDAQADIATTDRQHLKEDDPRFVKLKEYIDKTILGKVETKWREWRAEDSESKAKTNPAIEEWYTGLSTTNKKYARQLFAKIESFPIESPTYKRELYRHGILAFEKLALKENLDVLDKIETQADLELVKSVFGGIDELEAAEYHSIVRGRLDVMKAFEKLLPESREKIIQEHLFDHLWLLDPSWERASTNQRIEEAVLKEFEGVDADLTPDEKAGRIDIRYRTAAGKHIIIELKRYDRKVTVYELLEQLDKYRNALLKCLSTKFPKESQNIECIAILGAPPTPEGQDEKNESILKSINGRFITYDTLIMQTQESYKDYLDKNKKLSALAKLIDSI